MYALKNNVARLQEDHDNAAWMAEQLREAGADVMRQDTNMLFVRVGGRKCCRVRRIHESEKRAD
ncbi:low specificity L-threonine aldolase [Escherichia coli]|uniref:Low specificity L-threonine aldolase n=1 Tax=Escherichia coli TaxID=562 RepID=A0A376THV0_ECOLX|nr:low specificity L-threonine aldolase [Escherichia coli]